MSYNIYPNVSIYLYVYKSICLYIYNIYNMLNTKTFSSNLALVTTGNPPKNTPMEYSHLPPGSEYLQTLLECLQKHSWSVYKTFERS